MFEKAGSGRDAFTFSLHGMTTIASFAPATAIADDRINKAWDERFRGPAGRRRSRIELFEDFLGRYFAAGCLQT